jgi:hypothetical protein
VHATPFSGSPCPLSSNHRLPSGPDLLETVDSSIVGCEDPVHVHIYKEPHRWRRGQGAGKMQGLKRESRGVEEGRAGDRQIETGSHSRRCCHPLSRNSRACLGSSPAPCQDPSCRYGRWHRNKSIHATVTMQTRPRARCLPLKPTPRPPIRTLPAPLPPLSSFLSPARSLPLRHPRCQDAEMGKAVRQQTLSATVTGSRT